MTFTGFCALLLCYLARDVRGDDVETTPKIVQHPLSQQVVRDDPLTLDCRASGSPQPTVEWFRDGKPVRTAPADPTSHRILLPGGSLFFLRAMQNKREQDAGTYWCVASNDAGVARSNNATLDIAFLREEFRTEPNDTDALLGDPFVLQCVAPKGNPAPVVRWRKDGRALDLTSSRRVRVAEGGSLAVTDARKTDQGRYECEAENAAGVRLSRPVRVRIMEPPSFITQPSSAVVISGQDVLLKCQAKGDPHPDIVWSRVDAPIDPGRVRAIPGKGLRISSARRSDSGEYVCGARNAAGATAAPVAQLQVHEPPKVAAARPLAEVRAAVGRDHRVELRCKVTGSPAPVVFWTVEESEAEINVPDLFFFFPGDVRGRAQMAPNGSLLIENPLLTDSGRYACAAANEAGGVVLGHSHLLVYDPKDFDSEEALAKHSDLYHTVDSPKQDKIRLALRVSLAKAYALGGDSVRLTWETSDSKVKVSGFRVWFKAEDLPPNQFRHVDVAHAEAASFVVTRLKPATSYAFFVQPYAGEISGYPSSLVWVETRQAPPEEAPTIVEARLINATTIFLAWDSPDEDKTNGDLLGYEILILGNGTWVSNNVSAAANEVTLFVSGMAPDRLYSIQMAAFNAAGPGPKSEPLQIEMDPLLFEQLQEDKREGTRGESEVFRLRETELARLTWIIVVVAALSFGLILISAALFVYRKRFFSDCPTKPGYLEAASTDDDFHPCRQFRNNNNNPSLWVDSNAAGKRDVGARRELEAEEESNSSERKLLANISHSNSNSDTEYTYVTNARRAENTSRSQGYRKCVNPSSPYATTDIFADYCNREYQQHQLLRPQALEQRHYETPIVFGSTSSGGRVTNGDSRRVGGWRKNRDTNHRGPCGSGSSGSGGGGSSSNKAAVSCDDLSRRSLGSDRRRNRTFGTTKDQGGPTAHLLDLLPPPPSHPPPATPGLGGHYAVSRENPYAASTESVISPRYLFAHPAYRRSPKSFIPNVVQQYRIRPTEDQPETEEAEEEEGVEGPEGQHPEAFFTRLLPHSKTRMQQELERDFESELQSFNEAITKLSGKGGEQQSSHKEESFDNSSSCCDADVDEEEAEEEVSGSDSNCDGGKRIRQ